MEIVLLFHLNWQGQAWYPLWFIFLAIAMGPLSVSSSNVLPPSTESTAFVSSKKVPTLPFLVTETQPSTARDINCILPEEDVFDEGWWDGAEELDLTLPSEDSLEDNLENPSNETDDDDLDCEFFLHFPPPPKWKDLPPPPMPPILKDINVLLQEFKRIPENSVSLLGDPVDSSKENMVYISALKEELDGQCSLCDWANGGNQTLNLFAKRQSESTARVGRGLIGALIGVTFVSAALGAALMRLFLRCRSGGSLDFFTNPCSISVRMRNWPKSSSANTPNPTEVTGEERVKDEPTSGMEWAVKRWRRSSSQAPLHLSSSPASENSYVEEYCINNCDSNSAVYAELEPDQRFALNIDAQQRKNVALNSRTDNQWPKHDNRGYTSSEIPPPPPDSPPPPPPPPPLTSFTLPPRPEGQNDSPALSTLPLPSAYYSDISMWERPNEKENLANEEEPIGAALSISSRVQFHPIHLNVNACYKSPEPLPSSKSAPMPLQLLPNHLNPDNPNDFSNSSSDWNKSSILRATRNLLPQHDIKFNPQSRQILPQIDSTNAKTSPTTKMLSPKRNDNSLQPCEISSQLERINKPLPPLPSRRVNGPKRRRLKDSVVDPRSNGTLPSKSV